MITVRGFFKDINDNDILVEIQNNSEETRTVTINEENSEIWFAGESPVTITQDVENEFQHILSKQCTINLLCNSYVGDLFFAENARDVAVTITKFITTGMLVRRFVIFQGYVEPITFSQGFAHEIESFTLNCHDYLGTLEYLNYKDVTLSDYDSVKANATNISFKDIILDILPDSNIWYDQSKGLDSSTVNTVFQDLGIFETYMLGETYDDVWTKKDVLDEILRYLNLHIIQIGTEFYIFDWESLASLSQTRWYSIRFNNYKARSGYLQNLTKDNYAAADTTVSISDVYNQIQVTDELESLDTIINSPLDKDSLKSFYRKPVRYMTEYIAEGEGSEARKAFEILYHENPYESTNFEGAKQINWYAQPLYNINWKLNTATGDINDLVEFDNEGHAINAYKLPLYANEHQLTPLIMQTASYEQKKASDNSPAGKLSYTPYLFISMLGNDVDSSTLDSPGVTELTALKNRGPMIEYLSNQSGGAFSPVDEGTNYIVFSGTMLLLGRVWECDHWLPLNMNWGSGHNFTTNLYTGRPFWWGYWATYSDKMTDEDDHNKKRFYTRKFFREENGEILPLQQSTELPQIPDPRYEGHMMADYSQTKTNLMLWPDDKGHRQLKYKYSAFGNTTDKIKKLPVLECELIIGNKRLVEYFTDDEVGKSVFEWVDASTGKEYRYIDNNDQEQTIYLKTFTLGIDPKTTNGGDWIIGQEFELQNTVDFISGTAIAVKKSDALSGQVKFRILGPVNLTYNEITRKNGNFWYWHTRWYENTKSVLSHLESIIIKDFECKILVDGQDEISEDKDLVYVSDEVNNYISKADDISFKYITQLSAEECYEKGVTPSVNQNAVINLSQNIPLRELYNAVTQEVAKPEEHYVDQYFRIFSKPRVVMQTTLKDNFGLNAFESLYTATGIEKDSYVLGISQDLKMNTATVKLKENFVE